MSTAASQALVQKLYVAYYGRPADPAGLEAWALAIDANKGQVSTAIVNAFGASAESTALFGNMSTSQKVNAIYKQLFGRDAEPAGLLAWATAIDGGRVSAAGAALEILNGAAGDDKTTINNKLSAAAAFTAALDTTAEITAYSGDTVANAARSFLAGVTTAAPSTDVVNTAVASVTNTSAGGNTFTLTTGLDNIVGTSGNDTLLADNTGTAKYLSVGDQINGNGGTDTLKVYLADGDTSLNLPTLNSIESLEFNGGALAAIDTSAITGLTSLTVDSRVGLSGTGTATTNAFNYTLAGQSLTLANAKANSNAATAAVVTTTTLSSTTDTAENVTLSKFGNTSRTVSTTTYTDTNTLDIAGAKVTSLTLTSTGGTNAVTLTNTGTKLDTLTIKGDKALTVTENLAALKTINAADATGNVTVNASSANAALAFTGGSGNDKIALAASTLVNTQVLNGGSAGTDTVVLADTSLNATQITAANTALKNIDILGFNGATIAQGLSTITAVSQFSIEGAMTGTTTTGTATSGTAAAGGIAADFSGQSNAQSFVINANLTGGNGQASSAGTSGSGAAGFKVAPTLDNGSNSVAVTLSGVTITGGNVGAKGANSGDAYGTNGVAADLSAFETVTITSNANEAGTVTTNTFTGGSITASGSPTQGAGLTVGANATITISGAAAANLGAVISNVGQSVNNNITLNAGNLTGNLTVGTGAGNDVITAGSGVNSITLAGGVDSVDLSKSAAKADTITVGSAAGTTKTGIISITSFTSALNTGDKLDVAGNNGLASAGTGTVNTGGATAVTATINAKGVVSFSAVGASAAIGDHVDAVFETIGANANKMAVFQFGGDTYVAVDINGTKGYDAGTDYLVKLVGVTGVAELSTTASGVNTVWAA